MPEQSNSSPVAAGKHRRQVHQKKFIYGLSAFPITPQSPDGEVDAAGLARLVKRLVDARVHSVGLLGSTGTYAFLDREQRRRAVEVAADVIAQSTADASSAGDVHAENEDGRRRPLLLVGVGHLRTNCAIDIAKDALAAGADAGLLSPVSYNPLNDEEVFEHFRAIAEAVPELPLVIYNNEGTTRFKFSPELVGRLAAEIPSVVAVKYPSPARFEDAAAQHRALSSAVQAASGREKDFCIGYSRDAAAVEGLLAGGDAWFSVFGGLFPQKALELLTAAQRGAGCCRGDQELPDSVDAIDQARALNTSLQPLWECMSQYGSLHVAYCVANVTGLSSAQLPRPLLPLRGDALASVKAALKAADLRV